MSRVRISHQNQVCYVGPLATGFHFCDINGTLNNTYLVGTDNYNLIFPIDRVFSADYSISTEPAALKQLGNRTYLDRPLINPPDVNLSFSYYVNGIKNEARLGMDVNYARFDGNERGRPWYPSRVCPISGLVDRQLLRITGNPFWVHTCKDFKNIFFVVGPEGQDIQSNSITTSKDERYYDTGSANYHILAFGNCYLTNYTLNASVGDFPQATVNYSCENAVFLPPGNLGGLGGGAIPGVEKKNFGAITNKNFLIPKLVYEGVPTVLTPGDITVSISGNGRIYDAGLDFSDAKVQSFSLDIPLERESLNSLSWRLPLDRVINLPVISTLNLDLIVGENSTGSLMNFFSGRNHEYNVSVSMLGSSGCTYAKFPSYVIDMYSGYLRNVEFRSEVEGNKTASLSFDTQVDPENLNFGVFISGRTNILNIDSLPTF